MIEKFVRYGSLPKVGADFSVKIKNRVSIWHVERHLDKRTFEARETYEVEGSHSQFVGWRRADNSFLLTDK